MVGDAEPLAPGEARLDDLIDAARQRVRGLEALLGREAERRRQPRRRRARSSVTSARWIRTCSSMSSKRSPAASRIQPIFSSVASAVAVGPGAGVDAPGAQVDVEPDDVGLAAGEREDASGRRRR